MSSKIILMDIDDTVGNIKVRLQNILRKAVDESISFNDWREFGKVPGIYGINTQKMGDMFVEDQTLTLMEPHEGAPYVTQTLKELGFNVVFVTARAWHPEAREVTTEWLDRNGFVYDQLVIVPLDQCKEEATRDLGPARLFVDDRYDHCLSLAKSGRVDKVLLMTQPWNEDIKIEDERIIRIEDIRETLDLI